MKRRPRILLADDHTMLLDAFRRLLEPRCEIVGTACDGRALIDLAANTRPDVIVLDITMPRLNGLDATGVIRKEVPSAKVVILSQHQPALMKQVALTAGAGAYVTKSEVSRELMAAIDGLLSNGSSQPVEDIGKRPS